MKPASIVSIVTVIILSSAIAILFYLHFTAGSKYVYVDAQKLVNGYAGMIDARKEYEQKSLVWKANLDTLRREAEVKIKEYEATVAKLSASEKKLMEELIASKQEQFNTYQQFVSDNVRKSDQELSAKVLAKVNDYIKRYGSEKGYTIIMAATQYGNIVYAEDKVNITEDVLVGLNAEYAR
nr:outer membrane protein [uncultured bacterium]